MRTHGLKATYGVGCRCADCTRANRESMRAYYRRKGARPAAVVFAERRQAALASDNHGTETRYSLGCRCDRCREAARVARARRRAKVAA
jgi:bacterioferritin-associated ferredoxin